MSTMSVFIKIPQPIANKFGHLPLHHTATRAIRAQTNLTMESTMSSAPKKVVLAYSGGLDTSIILKWLQV